MIARVLEWSLEHRGLVIAVWIGIAVAGVLSALRLPFDAFPDTTPVQVHVNAVAPALSPLEIERQITRPLEIAIAGVPGLREVRSVSKFGFAQVTVGFADGTDLLRARQLVAERLQIVDWPPGIDPPRLGPTATGLGEVFHYLVHGQGQDLAALRAAQEWIIAPQLRSVPGVAEVNTWGGDERQVHVIVDPLDLQRYELTLAQVTEAIAANNANVGGGTLDRAGESSLIQGIGVVTEAEDIERMVIAAYDGVPVRIGDVARVAEDRALRRGAVTAGGGGEVVLGLAFMLPGENSRAVTHALAARLDAVRKSLPQGVEVTPVYERSALVDRVLHTVRNNLFEGALLVIAVLFVFLGNLRAGLLVALAIPLSMLFAANWMLRFGVAGSLMSLGAIDFGLLVDSAVIQVENVMRRTRAEPARPIRAVVRDAVLEVRKPTLFGELIIAIVYLPILTLEGIEGKLFRPMAATVLFALAGSMALSLTLIPALASYGFGTRHAARGERLNAWLAARYRPLLLYALGRPRRILGIAVAVLLVAGAIATRLGSEFVPRLREGAIAINTVRLAGVSLDESVRYGTRIEQALLAAFPNEIERIWSRTGTAEITTDPMGIEVTDVFVMLQPRRNWERADTQEELATAMAASLESFPGMRAVFTQPIEMRVNEMTAGIRTDVGVQLFGDDLDLLKAKAREVEEILEHVPGAADIVAEQITGQPMLEIEVDRDAIARHGIPAREVLAAVEALAPVPVGFMQEGDRRIPIAVRLDARYRDDVQAVGGILVTGANGDRVPLARLADIRVSDGPAAIQREWGKRRVVVQANVRGRDVGSFVAEARREVEARVQMPAGSYIEFGGQFENLARARTRLLIVVPIALVLILGLLVLTYGRFVDAARVFTGVPFAAVGGILALWIRDIPFSVSAGVGFVALAGVSVLGDMVLVSTVRQHTSAGLPLNEAIERAALTRLRPVLMTALVASLGFVPMALNTGLGAEVQRPLATVVIGGVVSSTLLTLLVLPVLYRVIGTPPRVSPPQRPRSTSGATSVSSSAE